MYKKTKKATKEYTKANIAYLKQVAAEADILTLPKGILYKVINTGIGTISPTLSNIVSVHYRGTLINGKEFDSTLGNVCPEPFRLSDVIVGWQIALLQMHVGDKWMLYIPAEMGYGNRSIDDIPGGSALTFEVELMSIS